jgi:uncharacterized membrane protein YkvI
MEGENMKYISKIMIVIGIVLMFSAVGNDDMTAAHYPLVKILTLLYVGLLLIVNGALIGKRYNK